MDFQENLQFVVFLAHTDATETKRIVSAGCCPDVIAQWQSTDCARYPGFDSQ